MSSGDKVQIAWQAWDIVRVSFGVAGAAFGADPLCGDCFFPWQAQYLGHLRVCSCKIGTPARGAMLLSSFVPVYVAGASGDGATRHTLHCTVDTPHPQSALHTFHFSLDIPHFTLYTLHFTLRIPHFRLRTPHFNLQTPQFTPHTLHVTLHTSHFTLPTFLHSPIPTPLHSRLRTSHSMQYIPHSTLHCLYSTLRTPHSALHPIPHSTVYTGTLTGEECTKLLKLLFCNSVLCDCNEFAMPCAGRILGIIGSQFSLWFGLFWYTKKEGTESIVT